MGKPGIVPRSSCSLVNTETWVKGLAKENDHLLKENLASLRVLGEKQNVTLLLREVISDPALLSSIASRSYTHINHFDKIILIDAPSHNYRLTLHVWWPINQNKQLDDEPMHDHRFDFWSTILTGKLKSYYFSQASSGKQYQKFEYIPEEENTSSIMRYIGESKLKETRCTELRVGDCYYLPYSVIHKILLLKDQVTSTLVLRGPQLKRSAYIYKSCHTPIDYELDRPVMGADELKVKLTALCDILVQERQVDRRQVVLQHG